MTVLAYLQKPTATPPRPDGLPTDAGRPGGNRSTALLAAALLLSAILAALTTAALV